MSQKLKYLFALACCYPVLAFAIEPDSEVVYKTVDDIELKLHVFKHDGHKASDQRPAIVFFFGGGWYGGTPTQFHQQSEFLAGKGIVSFSAEYRVRSRNNTTPVECVKDAKSAVRWIRENANKLGVDPNRIVASGGSAGGHIAGATGVIEGCEEEGEDLSVSSVPNLMILFNPVLDTTKERYGSRFSKPEHQIDLSLNHKVKPGIVPTLLFHGMKDTTVPFEDAERFDLLMNKAGNECQLAAFEDSGHGFFNGSFFRKNNSDDDFNLTMKQSVDFLIKHGYLTAEK